MTSNKFNFFSIVVLYNPEYYKLFNLCQILSSFDINVVLVDNSDLIKTDFTIIKELTRIQVIELYDNFGIAKAQNIGINYALENNAEAILFFDQDSQIDSTILNDLVFCISNPGVKICAPVFSDADSGVLLPITTVNKSGFIYKFSDFYNNSGYPIVISSGLFVKVEVFKTVGFMNEDYFIDYVDTDFCFRCLAHNVKIVILGDALMKHSIGNALIKILGFHFSKHNPQRVYYQIRNCFIFCKKDYVPFLFKLREVVSITFHQFFLFLFFYDKRNHYLKAIFLGLIHGFSGRIGKFSLNLD